MASESANLRNRKASGSSEKEPQSRSAQKNKFKSKPSHQQIPLGYIFKSQRYWARFVIILAVVVIIYVSSLNTKEKKFARQREVLPFRFQPLRCQAKGDTVKGCTPKNCGRYISDNLISDDELRFLMNFAKSGFDRLDEGSAHHSATFDLISGVVSTGKTNIDLRNHESSAEVFKEEHLLALKLVKGRVLQSLEDRFDITRSNVHLAAPLYFSKLTNVSHLEDHTVHRITRDIHPEVFYTTVVYLKDHGKDFKGGRMMLIDDPPTNRTLSSIEARAGRIMGVTSGKENLHYNEAVTSGIQYQLTIHFTCEASAVIPDPWNNKLE